LEWVSGAGTLRIRREREAHHIQIAGDTGSGKSTLVRDVLYQVEGRGETAIVFDPDREYIQEFFDDQRGDWVLNPKDERCPYWPIGDEADDEATATPIANGLFPDEPTLQRFFLDHTRAIFAYLLATWRPTVSELAYWMAHPEEIDQRVRGTEHEHTLTVNAAPQRAGILGSLNHAGKPLRMMPVTPSGRRTWTLREWAKQRRGWIFITSTPETLDALRPLQSLWLDMLILKLQSSEMRPGQSRVWMILDELAALNALPQLHAALTKQRKSDNPIVLGFQGMSQLDALYGKKAETILSQAYTNIVLRTREPRAAEHLSKLIGDAQLERVTESMPAHWFGYQRHSFSTQRVIDPVVLKSEIQGLADLRGYFVQQDKVVSIRFHPRAKRRRAEGLIERMIPASRHQTAIEMTTPPAVAAQPVRQEQAGMAITVE
jgi:type IV secretory pathway TraG/TraD family ATPase VirD4